jgi:hypothetical protein
MMPIRHQQRKTSPKVLGGKAQRKNRWAKTPTYWNTRQKVPVVDREEPGWGYRHLLRRRDVLAFVEIIPDWDTIADGLDAIVLARGEWNIDGWHDDGVIGICAWDRELWQRATRGGYEEHAAVYDRLGVPVEPVDDEFLLKFTESTAAAYQLLHVFLHELGHHRDRMTTRSRRRTARGEGYAERYALELEPLVWDRYLRVFGSP